jgi:hypothetical protein
MFAVNIGPFPRHRIPFLASTDPTFLPFIAVLMDLQPFIISSESEY